MIQRFLILLTLGTLLFSCSKSDDDGNTPSGKSGKITYVQGGSVLSLNDIMEYNVATEANNLVTNGNAVTRKPDNQLYLTYFIDAFANDTTRIKEATADGATQTPFHNTKVKGATQLYALAASPNGQYLSYTVNDSNNFVGQVAGTVIVNTATKQTIKKIKGLFDAKWTPDNRLVGAGTRYNGVLTSPNTFYNRPGIFVTDASFTTLTRIDPNLSNPFHPAVSPDGATVACVVGGHLHTFPLSGGAGSIAITITSGSKKVSYPTFSPDGTYIACSVYGTFESTFYSAMAIVPTAPAAPTELANDFSTGIWPKDPDAAGTSTLGRINMASHMVWR